MQTESHVNERSRKAIQSSTLELLIQSSPQAIMITDRETTEVLYVNDAASQILGNDMLGKRVDDEYRTVDPAFGPVEDSNRLVERSTHPAERLKRDGAIPKTEGRWMTSQGVIDVEFAARSLRDPVSGRDLGIYSFTDVSHLRKAERALRESLSARERLIEELRLKTSALNQALETKQQLISQLSHEVKNPLNVILGFSDLLLESATKDVELKNGLQTIERNAKHILAVVQDQLDQSADHFRESALELTRLAFDSIAARLQSSQGMLASRKGLEFKVTNRLQDASFETDYKLFTQVMMNLIGNAIKFTRVGVVEVIFDRNRQGQIQIEVSDTGNGISTEDQRRLFEPFFQAEKNATLRAQGTGLGLNIARGIANRLGGSLQLLRSAPGEGSTFALILPD